MAASIGVPTVSGVGNALTAYGVGIAAGLGYRLLTGITGSGILGGAISAAIVGATVRGQVGDTISAMLGFTTGQGGLEGLGLGNILGGLGGGRARSADDSFVLI